MCLQQLKLINDSVVCTYATYYSGTTVDIGVKPSPVKLSEPDSRDCAIRTRPQTTFIDVQHFSSKIDSTSEKTEQFQTTHQFSKSYQSKHSPWYRRGLGENQAAISSLLGPVLSRCDSTCCLGKGKVAGLALCDRSKHRSHDGEPPKLRISE